MPVPVLSVPQMRQWEEASWSAGRSPDDVIDQVGRLIAEQILQLSAPKQKILVLAGKGNNGRDARAVLNHILARGPVLIDAADPESALPRLREALASPPDLIVDGLFGIGLDRPLSEPWARLINTINESRAAVVAIDVPSGLNADTGQPEGAAIRASRTITLGAPKVGLLRESASPFVGQIVLLPDIGLAPMPPFEAGLWWSLPGDFRGYPPPREASGQKGDYGHAVLVTGSPGFHGAAVLAAHGAQRARPGLVTVVTQPGSYLPVASQLQAAMARAWRPGEELPPKTTALLCGPGLGQPEQSGLIRAELQKRWLESRFPVVVDASALDWLPAGPASLPAPRVITPHPGEAGRLLGTSAAAVQADRMNALRALSRRFGHCWVVLKGRQTLVGRDAGPVQVNSSGNPGLAQGGSGDLLAGFITGLLAQAPLAEDPAQALAFAVWAHGHAADTLAALQPNWTIEDLSRQLGLRSNP